MVRSGGRSRPHESKLKVVCTQPDPNNDDEKAFMHWILSADYYTLPHVQRFNPWGDMQSMLAQRTD